jgi:DNA-binding winged helix-turn-helix (wHTH) protein
VIGRAEIAEHVWDESFDPFSNLIEVYVNRLRKKIDPPGTESLLHTRRGAGYFLGVAEEAAAPQSNRPGLNGEREREKLSGPSPRKNHV